MFITGVLFSVFGGQPLLVISLELPLSIFDGLLHSICDNFGIDFLPFRLWVGVWTVLFLVVFIALDVSWYLRYITRFTLEVFVVVPPLVLFMYGFVHMCQMIKAYSDLPGTFNNQTCLCLKPTYEIRNVTSTLSPTVMDGISTSLIPSTTRLLNDTSTNGLLAENITITLQTISNSTLSTTVSTSSINQVVTNATTTITSSTTELPVVGTVVTTVYEVVNNGIHFRDCIANNWTLEGTACDHGVYPFTSMLTLSTIVLMILLTSFQHLGYLPKQVCIWRISCNF